LSDWVKYAQTHKALILFDSAYEAFIVDEDVPHSIYEIEGAREVAIEFRSFSKTAGFTGIRCGYTVIPKELKGRFANGCDVSLNALWNRRQCTKFNGASYIAQRGAEAIYTEKGQCEIRQTIQYYLANAKLLRDGMTSLGLQVVGGINAPYVWIKAPDGITSWDFFDRLLSDCHVAGTPGSGFGSSGEGYLRLTAFNTYENTAEAVNRLSKLSL
jgi:LL-diaminopimelate aminotransferase